MLKRGIKQVEFKLPPPQTGFLAVAINGHAQTITGDCSSAFYRVQLVSPLWVHTGYYSQGDQFDWTESGLEVPKADGRKGRHLTSRLGRAAQRGEKEKFLKLYGKNASSLATVCASDTHRVLSQEVFIRVNQFRKL